MANFLYVDNSNLWIEGMHVAAVKAGTAPDIWTAQKYRMCEKWSYDFGKLMEFAGGDDIGRAVLYGSRPPPNDSLWTMAERKGFEVVVYDRNFQNKEKKIDTTIVRDITKDSIKRMTPGKDEVTLVSGDSDYVPLAEDLNELKIPFHVVFWDHAARELKEVCTRFTSLNDYLEHLQAK
jgi:uncharacterized LabA/DUF88 family protein